jgi:hypothetical protein
MQSGQQCHLPTFIQARAAAPCHPTPRGCRRLRAEAAAIVMAHPKP